MFLVHTFLAQSSSTLLLLPPPPYPLAACRFVPEEMDLSQRQVRDAASDVPPGYTPPDLFTGALQHTDPKLSWDEGDKRRKKVRHCYSWKRGVCRHVYGSVLCCTAR
jgi:hypothetical protein